MSDISNEGGAFPSPQSAVSPESGVTNLMLEHLRNTRPWVLFLAIMTVIGASLMAIGGLVTLLGTACLGSRGGGSSAFRNLDLGGGTYGMITALSGLVYIVASVLEIPIIVYLFRYANAINALLNTRRPADLEKALQNQQAYWKYVGILTIVAVGLVVIAVFIGLIIGVSAGLGRLR